MHDFYFIPGPPNPIFEALIDIYVVEKPILDSGQESKKARKNLYAIDFSNARTEVALRAIMVVVGDSGVTNITVRNRLQYF